MPRNRRLSLPLAAAVASFAFAAQAAEPPGGQQAAPGVAQGQPLEIEIRQKPAQIIIRQQPPEVIVRQGGATVDAKVTVHEAKPEIIVEQPPQAAASPGGPAASAGPAAGGGAVAQEAGGQNTQTGQPQASASTERRPAGQSGAEPRSPAGAAPDKAQAAAGGGQAAQTRAAAVTPPRVDPAELQRLAGTEAVTMDGKSVGELAKVVVKDNNVYGAVIETGGFLGIGEFRHVVPLDKIRVQNAQIVVDMSEQELDRVPGLESGPWKDLKN